MTRKKRGRTADGAAKIRTVAGTEKLRDYGEGYSLRMKRYASLVTRHAFGLDSCSEAFVTALISSSASLIDD
jgi:hypothetical protein